MTDLCCNLQIKPRLKLRGHDVNTISRIACTKLFFPPRMANPNSLDLGVGSDNSLEFFNGAGSANFDAVLASVVACKKKEIGWLR
jgi:hypothetical protein